jgi:uracil DNA glycosylase
MGAEFDKPYMEQLQKFLQQEWAGREAIFPPQPFIFRAYNTVPFDKIKVGSALRFSPRLAGTIGLNASAG